MPQVEQKIASSLFVAQHSEHNMTKGSHLRTLNSEAYSGEAGLCSFGLNRSTDLDEERGRQVSYAFVDEGAMNVVVWTAHLCSVKVDE
jgi:hypothetical protein